MHGNPGEVSKLEIQRTNLMIQAVHDQIRPQVSRWSQDIFALTEEARVAQSYPIKVAWLESIKLLFPETYKQLVLSVVGKLQTESELNMIKLRGVLKKKGKKTLCM